MQSFMLELTTPEKPAQSQEITAITLPGEAGAFQVLYNHAPLISTLAIGKIKVNDTKGNETVYACSGGVAEVLNNKVLVLVESIEISDEIDVDRAEKAAERAKKRLERRKEKSVDERRAEFSLKRAINRLQISGHYKKQ
jgi:F-type H+-transporting ATPase subunit epsilon